MCKLELNFILCVIVMIDFFSCSDMYGVWVCDLLLKKWENHILNFFAWIQANRMKGYTFSMFTIAHITRVIDLLKSMLMLIADAITHDYYVFLQIVYWWFLDSKRFFAKSYRPGIIIFYFHMEKRVALFGLHSPHAFKYIV